MADGLNNMYDHYAKFANSEQRIITFMAQSNIF